MNAPRGLRRHLTYPNVMSTLAVFLVLAGGTALAAGLPKNSVTSKTVKNNSLTSADLADGKGVSGADVADGSLTGADLADRSLTGATIADGSLTGADLAPGSVGAAQLAKGAVGSEQLAAGSVTGPNVVDKSLTGADFAPDSVIGRNVDESTLQAVPNTARLDGVFGSEFLSGQVDIKTTTPDQIGLALGDGTFKISETCPAQSIMIGGGPIDMNAGSTLVESFPKDNTWSVRINPHGASDPFGVRVDCVLQNF